MEETIKNKLDKLEKTLSLKYLARDIILIQMIIIGASIIAGLLLLLIINYATGTSDPVQTINTAQTSSNFISWILYISVNILAITFGTKAKRTAIKIKQEIIELGENKK